MKDKTEYITEGILSEMLYHEGVIAYRAGNTKKAIECFKASIEVDPKNNNAELALEKVSKCK